jgi:hypothetical protein
MQPIVSLSRGVDAQGKPWVMCPICFEGNEVLAAEAGGMLSRNDDGTLSDVCVRCAATEFLGSMRFWSI